MFRKVSQEAETYLGDVWQKSATRQAYQDGKIRSLVQMMHPNEDDKNPKELKIEFTNASPCHDLILCWISSTGELHHFYRLAAKAKCLETTYTGDAFVAFQAPTTTAVTVQQNGDEKEKDEEKGMAPQDYCNKETVVVAYRPRTIQTAAGELAQRHLVTFAHDNNNDKSSEAPSTTSSGLRGTAKKQRIADETAASNTKSDIIQSWTVVVQNGSTTDEPSKPKPKPIDTRDKVYHEEQFGPWKVHWEPGCWDDFDPENPELSNNANATTTTTTDTTATATTTTTPGSGISKRQALEKDLYAATQLLPSHVLEVLSQSTAVYMNQSHPYAQAIDNPVGCYHPGREWLEMHLMNPQKAENVEFYSADNYFKHRRFWGTGMCLCV